MKLPKTMAILTCAKFLAKGEYVCALFICTFKFFVDSNNLRIDYGSGCKYENLWICAFELNFQNL